MTWVRAGRTGVDTGSILITDPCYVVRNPGDEHFEPYKSYDQLIGAVDFEAPYSQLTNQYGADIGVYITHFGGDGVFAVYVDVDPKTKQVLGAQIRFDGGLPQ